MKHRTASLQRRLSIGIGLLVILLWMVAASQTLRILQHDVDEVFDSALQETAQRVLPLAAFEISRRADDDDDVPQRLATIGDHEEDFTYVVRDARGRMLIQSHDANLSIFPPYDGAGYRQDENFRFYNEEIMHGAVTITVAEHLHHRREVVRDMKLALGLPLFAVIPLSLIGIIIAVQRSFAPLRRLRDALVRRGTEDLSPIGMTTEMPSELAPIADALDGLLARLQAAFEAERSFAANAAHELRTPLAGAIAQAQRLQAETKDPAAMQRAAGIEKTLKRLTRLSERLMQLARAEGGRLRTEQSRDLRPVIRLVADDIRLINRDAVLVLDLPAIPVMSDIDPDAFGILCRNLIENAVRHGMPGEEITISFSAEGMLKVVNDGPTVPAEALDKLTDRFARSDSAGEGSGLGLAIVRTITDRAGGKLVLHSPARDRNSGFEACLDLALYDKP